MSSKNRSLSSSLSSTIVGSVAGTTLASSTDLASFFECPVCFEYVLPPILQCPSGHLVISLTRTKTLISLKAVYKYYINKPLYKFAYLIRYVPTVDLNCHAVLLAVVL